MIPTLIVLGLVFGRWWRLSLAVAATAWPLVLVIDGAMDLEPQLLGASALAAVNAGVGVLIHQVVLHCLRWLRGQHLPASKRPQQDRC